MSGSDNGTSPSRYWTPPTSLNSLTRSCPTLLEWHWEHQDHAPGYYIPVSEAASQIAPGLYHSPSATGYDYDETQYPRISSPPRIPTPIPTQTPSPLLNESDSDSDSEGTVIPSETQTVSPEGVPPTPSILTDSTTSGTHLSRSTETSSVHIESKPKSLDEPTSRPEQSSPMTRQGRTWPTSSPSTGEHCSISDNPPTLTSRCKPMPTNFRSYIPYTWDTNKLIYTPEPRRSNTFYNASSFTYPSYRATAPTWMAPPMNLFETFEYTFEPGFQPSQITEDVPDFYIGPPQRYPKSHSNLPRPLPDSPPNPQCPRFYSGRRTSRRLTGAGTEEGMERLDAGGSGQALPPNDAACLQQAHQQAALLCAEINRLNQELKQARKGKDRGRQPRQGLPRDQFSVPRPGNYGGPPMHRPTGAWPTDNPPPMAGIKLILMRTPALFKGEHDNIKQFVRNCLTYFEAFCMYYLNHPALMVVFLTSHLEGPAQDCNDDNDDSQEAGPCYRYPEWDDFLEIFRKQFRNPAIEEHHKKEMGKLHMEGNNANLFFRKMERLAKLAG
ncbi:hypothetical protein EDD85DRAFT_791186 [Armillaria nabsnona]|nr:hypothetical protein EDD85DRAFT_791186 [Armillaria nabsnona]